MIQFGNTLEHCIINNGITIYKSEWWRGNSKFPSDLNFRQNKGEFLSNSKRFCVKVLNVNMEE